MNPILKDFAHEIKTERLIIRMPQYDDGRQIYEAIMASKDELKAWLPFANKETSKEDVEIENRHAHIRFLQRTELRMYIFEKDSGIFLGSTGFHNIDWDIARVEIGYWLDTRYTGKGYMTEVVEALTDFAISELKAKRIEIRCDALNIKSKAIPERLGFTLEGILKNQSLATDGKTLTDTMIYAKIV